jgi:predicted transcriptional regulator
MQKMSLSFKVDARLKKALEDLANQENRSLSNYVITLLIKHLKEKGIDWLEENPKRAGK